MPPGKDEEVNCVTSKQKGNKDARCNEQVFMPKQQRSEGIQLALDQNLKISTCGSRNIYWQFELESFLVFRPTPTNICYDEISRPFFISNFLKIFRTFFGGRNFQFLNKTTFN